MIKFQIRDILIWITLVAVVLSQLIGEPAIVGGATVFCLVSIVLFSAIATASLTHLGESVIQAVRQVSWVPIVGRIKWMPVDIVILLWVFATISTTHRVFDMTEANGANVLIAGWVVAPLIGIWLWYKCSRHWNENRA